MKKSSACLLLAVLVLAIHPASCTYRLKFTWDSTVKRDSHAKMKFANLNKTTFYDKVNLSLSTQVVAMHDKEKQPIPEHVHLGQSRRAWLLLNILHKSVPDLFVILPELFRQFLVGQFEDLVGLEGQTTAQEWVLHPIRQLPFEERVLRWEWSRCWHRYWGHLLHGQLWWLPWSSPF